MAMFKAFKPSGMEKIARSMGYQGSMQGFQDYVSQDPMRQQQMQNYTNQAMQMARGGVARKKLAVGGAASGAPLGNIPGAAVMPKYYNPQTGQTYLNKQAAPDPSVLQPYNLQTGPGAGGNMTAAQLQQAGAATSTPPTTATQKPVTTGYTGITGTPIATPPAPSTTGQPGVTDFTVQQMYAPGVPVGGETIATGIGYDPSQDIAAGTGALTGTVATPTAMALTAQAAQPAQTQANLMQAAQAAPGVDSAMNATQAAQANPQDPRAQITAAQQTTSSVGNLTAAQGNASLINNPVQRQIQSGELLSLIHI